MTGYECCLNDDCWWFVIFCINRCKCSSGINPLSWRSDSLKGPILAFSAEKYYYLVCFSAPETWVPSAPSSEGYYCELSSTRCWRLNTLLRLVVSTDCSQMWATFVLMVISFSKMLVSFFLRFPCQKRDWSFTSTVCCPSIPFSVLKMVYLWIWYFLIDTCFSGRLFWATFDY